MNSPAETIDWGAPLDGETSEEMFEEANRRRHEEDQEAERNRLLWEKYAHRLTRTGELIR